MSIIPFSVMLEQNGLELRRGQTRILQINVGYLCNQNCRHCHLECGPNCREIMDTRTMDEVVAFVRRSAFQAADITGGAPELNPGLPDLILKLAPLVPRLMLRSNLTAVAEGRRDSLLELCRDHRVVLIASFPAVNAAQLEAQRGKGVWEKSVTTLKKLNAMGYGDPASGLEIHLVSNPTGAFLPTPQAQAEKRFRRDLSRKFGIVFNNLYTFANVPLGRFRHWLQESGNYQGYMQRLVSSFNPCAVDGLMCRTQVSVSWDGYLFDCDFNLADRMFLGGQKTRVGQLDGPPPVDSPIMVSDHCYACTAGSGFT